jgi:hypothetical protein
MPATGVRPPLLMLVAVRASAPVAGMPPKNGTTMLAMPCAISSWLASCLSPVRLSATTAHSSDSMAPKSAMVKAGVISSDSVAQSSAKPVNAGSPCGMPPNLLPMVATGRWNSATVTVASSSAMNGDGSSLLSRLGHSRISASEAPDTASVMPSNSAKRALSVVTMAKKPAGICATGRPKKSLSWVRKISTAIPLVKPVISGIGKNLITCPSRITPISTSITPAMKVQIRRLATPYLATMP